MSYSAENLNEENGDDLLYDREILTGAKDKFMTENGDLPIHGIEIHGLEKTKKSVVLNESGITAGDKLSVFNPHRFINNLNKKNLFTDIHINYTRESEEVVIDLYLHEKWTVIPLPMFYSNGDSIVYGFFILESNFLGYAKTVFTGATYSANSKSAVFGYIDPSVCGTYFAANLFLFYKDSIDRNGTIDKVISQEFSSRQKLARIDAGYSLSNSIKLFLSEGYHDGIVDRHYSHSMKAPDSQNFYLTGALIKFDLLRYYEYLYYGLKGEMKCYTHIPVEEGNLYNTAEYKIDYSHKIFNFHRITFHSSGSSGNRPTVLEERISGKTGTRSLPPDIISADNYASYSIIYEFPFFRFSRGAVTLLCFWEQGIYNRDHSPYNNYSGTGGGILFYLKRVAFPAFGFNYAQNLKTGNREFSVNIGFAF